MPALCWVHVQPFPNTSKHHLLDPFLLRSDLDVHKFRPASKVSSTGATRKPENLVVTILTAARSNGLTEVQRSLPAVEANSPFRRRRVRRLRTHYLSIVSLCFVFSATCTVLEVFVLFNIEFCDGEDLMQLYWGFWSILQVGSNIAILGVMVQLWIVLGNVQTPSWAVALGTPVLVFAAIGWLFREISKQACKRILCREVKEDDSDDDSGDERKNGLGQWMSTA